MGYLLVLRLFFNPQAFRRFEVISKDGNDLLDLVVIIRVDKEIQIDFSLQSYIDFKLLSPSRSLVLCLGESIVLVVRIEFGNYLC